MFAKIKSWFSKPRELKKYNVGRGVAIITLLDGEVSKLVVDGELRGSGNCRWVNRAGDILFTMFNCDGMFVALLGGDGHRRMIPKSRIKEVTYSIEDLFVERME